MYSEIEKHKTEIAELCRRYEVKELAVFGSAARADFSKKSDIDLLVDFRPEAKVGFIRYLQLQDELASLLKRKVDLVSKPGLKLAIRGTVLSEAKIIYAI